MSRLHPRIVVELFDALNQFRPRLCDSRHRAGFGSKSILKRADFIAITLKLGFKLPDAAQHSRRRRVDL
ncbi:hypothetical protein AQ925_00365 [Burkholderia pseudomallei]|nr:hypothetical protein AQ914_13975 [Burkholderia pseudomallei]ONC88906.1 hypothetical protein AQ922_01355 [Burkholderia pseudomallei]ONC97271.1 hypothetical protein AQ925_00365 [Burkholderia pseudomallei]OND06044.1 hypothetical protein AQ926_29210 [Burkholderia pseudomallei]OND10768.1 hypothetical protein AQ928_03380 [Burkholderia pseudomallei]